MPVIHQILGLISQDESDIILFLNRFFLINGIIFKSQYGQRFIEYSRVIQNNYTTVGAGLDMNADTFAFFVIVSTKIVSYRFGFQSQFFSYPVDTTVRELVFQCS